MDPLWRIELFGGLKARQNGQEVVRFRTQKTGGLLALLAYQQNQIHYREMLIEQLWPDKDILKGRHLLSQALSSLRHHFEPPGIPAGSVIIADHIHIRLNPAAFATNVSEFSASLQSAHQTADLSERIWFVRQAISIYAGELLPGLYEEWVLVERERLKSAFSAALRQCTADLQQRGEREMALEYALHAVAIAPDRVEAHEDLIRLYAALGRNAEAIRQYQLLANRLKRAIQEPPDTLRALIEQLHAVKKTNGPRIAASPHRPLLDNVVSAPPAEPQNTRFRAITLPMTLTRFFGRETEIVRLSELLHGGSTLPVHHVGMEWEQPPRARLITLTGPGGVGKSRLAIETARHLADEWAGATYFVSLAGVADISRLPDLILGALGQPHSPTPPEEQIVAALAGRSALLLLDNWDRLPGDIVSTLLKRLPKLVCLVTSRQLLGIDGENAFPIFPLPVPIDTVTPEQLTAFACARMFVDRAQAVSPDFQITLRNAKTIAAICRQLEGLPLAIELAAAKTTVYSPTQMHAQLERRLEFLVGRKKDRTERHHSLQATIAWSYERLSPEMQRFFTRLSVFRGGWTLEAAEQVTGFSQDTPDFTEQLLQHSLILSDDRGDTRRFRMLEMLREFATEQLGEADRADVSRRHAEFFLHLAEEARSHLPGPDKLSWLDKLESEQDNFRAVLEWAGAGEIGLCLTGALGPFWLLRGYYREGRHWLECTVDQSRVVAPHLKARALHGLGVLARFQRDLGAARRSLEESLALYRQVGDAKASAYVLNSLALVADMQQDNQQAQDYSEQSLALLRSLGDQLGIAGALNNIGRRAQDLGDPAAAKAYFLESRQIYLQLGDAEMAAIILHNLGFVALHQGELNVARASFEQSLASLRALGNKEWVADLLDNLGVTLCKQGDCGKARPLLMESLKLQQEREDRRGCSVALVSIGYLEWLEGKPLRATRLLAAAEAARQVLDTPFSLLTKSCFEEAMAALRAALSDKDFAAAWAYGSVMTLEQAIAFALEV